MSESTLPDTVRSLQISADQPLTSSQRQFNSLIDKVARLRQEIAAEEEKMEALLKCAHKYLLPALERIAAAKLAVAQLLEDAALGQQLGKRQLREVGLCIASLCRQAFSWVDPTAEQQALHDRWAMEMPKSQESKREMKDLLEDQAEDLMGESVDWDSLAQDPERMQAFMDALEAQRTRTAEEARSRKQASSRQKVNKKEALQQAAEALKSRSIRAVYISLAKLLHPDLEPDPERRVAKEEEMKKVAAAYAAQDLAALLQLEVAWIYAHQNRLAGMSEDALGLYVEVLKDQVRTLQDEKKEIATSARYQWVQPFAQGKQAAGIQMIKSEAAYLDEVRKEIEALGRSFQAEDGRRAMTDYVKAYMRFVGDDD